MNLRVELLRYLRQRVELGDAQLFLESLDAEQMRRLVAVAGASRPRVAGAGPLLVRERPTEVASPAEVAQPADATSPADTADVASPPTASDPARALEVLGREAAGCTLCRLSETRTQVVFGDGTAAADVMVVGEAPGADEDRTGVPFVGRAGRLLDLMLQAVGFERSRVYICNVLKCRPPQNRDPQPDEVACCSPYLRRQIEIIRPSVLLAVGRFAAQTLTGSEASLGRLRREVHAYEGVPVVVTYHPAYLLRSPDQVRRAWDDLQLLRRVHAQSGAGAA